MSDWIEATNSAVIYERESGPHEILYVIPVKSILGKLHVVPVGDTGPSPTPCAAAGRGRETSSAPGAIEKWARETEPAGGL